MTELARGDIIAGVQTIFGGFVFRSDSYLYNAPTNWFVSTVDEWREIAEHEANISADIAVR